MNKPKDRPQKSYHSRDEIEKDLFAREEESPSGKIEKSRALDEETLRRIKKLFSAN